MKKFFKISLIIISILLVLYLCLELYLYYSYKEKFENLKDRVESFSSDNSDDYYKYSVNINKSGDFHKGFLYLNKAVELEPDIHLGYRGWLRLRKLRDYDKALEDFNRLDSLTPNFIDAPWAEDIDFLRGECYFGKKEYKKAIQHFNTSIKNLGEDLADVQSFVYLGIGYSKLEDYQNSIKMLNKGLEQSEYTCEAHFNLAKVYLELDNIKKAKEHILLAEEYFDYKRDDYYNEFLNEIYFEEILELKKNLELKLSP